MARPWASGYAIGVTPRVVGAAIAVGALGLVPACAVHTTGCTEIGCGWAFEVDFSPTVTATGDYRIDVTADGVATSCTVSLPFSSCDGAVSCDRADPGFLIQTSGCALPAAEHEILGVLWPVSGPAQATVEVSLGATVIATASFTPTYVSSQPNGADCEPTCTQATQPGTLAVP